MFNKTPRRTKRVEQQSLPSLFGCVSRGGLSSAAVTGNMYLTVQGSHKITDFLCLNSLQNAQKAQPNLYKGSFKSILRQWRHRHQQQGRALSCLGLDVLHLCTGVSSWECYCVMVECNARFTEDRPGRNLAPSDQNIAQDVSTSVRYHNQDQRSVARD